MNIHLSAIKRLFLGWLTVSILMGGGAYWYGLHQIGLQVITLAQTEVAKVAPAVLAHINGTGADIQILQGLANDYQAQGFVVVELYNRHGKMVAQKAGPDAKRIEEALDSLGPHLLPQGDRLQADHMRLDNTEVIRVLAPLFDGNKLEGHFEGIYVVPADKLAALWQETQRLLIIVCGVILFTTLLLYPFIISLNRKVHAEAHAILRSNMELMEVLGSAIAKRDSDTNSHNYRVTLYAVRLAEHVGLHKHHIKELIAGAFLHDVGKIGISDTILLKPGMLNEEEFAIMQQHVALGLDIINHSVWLRHASDVVGNHHEWFNGCGYPEGIAGESIPLTARIFAIADVFDALTSRRPYKEPFPLSQSLDMLQQQSGTHFDPSLLQAFLPIATDLYARFSQVDEKELAKDLRNVVAQYWNGGPVAPSI